MFWETCFKLPFKYYQNFSIYFAINFFLIGLGCFLISYIFRFACWIILKYCKNPYNEARDFEVLDGYMYYPYYELGERKISRSFFLVLECFRKIFKTLGIIVIGLIPSALSGFGTISPYWAFALTLLYYVIVVLLYLKRYGKAKEKIDGRLTSQRPTIAQSFELLHQKYPWLVLFTGIMIFFGSVTLPLATQNTCLCFYNSDYGFDIAPLATVSTRMMRSLTMTPVCPVGPPCHVYATIPEDPSENVFINAHTHYSIKALTVKYSSLDEYEKTGTLSMSSDSYSYPVELELNGKRMVHTTLLTNLEPNKAYYFEVIYDNQTQYSGKYKTLPLGDSQMISVIIGGDVGSSSSAQTLTNNLVGQSPTVFFIGGDSAYDNGMQNCWYSWDLFLNMFEGVSQKAGYLIPMVIGVGNHDVGFNAHSTQKFTPEDLPLYFYYFPQHFANIQGLTIPAVPDVMSRKTNFYHKIGSSLFFGLDSGYMVNYESQLPMISEVINETDEGGKFAYYHVPTYPACLSDDDPDFPTYEAQNLWAPTFESQGFDGIFENHVHMLKKTFPLKEGSISDSGIIYYGDGNWGISPNNCNPSLLGNSTGILEWMNFINHVWVVKFNKSHYEIFPVNIEGEKFASSTLGTFEEK